MPNMKSIRLKTKELQSNEVEASDFVIWLFCNFVISQNRASHFKQLSSEFRLWSNPYQ